MPDSNNEPHFRIILSLFSMFSDVAELQSVDRCRFCIY